MTPRPGIVFCDAGDLTPDLATLDALARMQIAATRLGLRLQLCDCSPELRAVISFAGLDEVLADARPAPRRTVTRPTGSKPCTCAAVSAASASTE